jgi:hypothetical protein
MAQEALGVPGLAQGRKEDRGVVALFSIDLEVGRVNARELSNVHLRHLKRPRLAA